MGELCVVDNNGPPISVFIQYPLFAITLKWHLAAEKVTFGEQNS